MVSWYDERLTAKHRTRCRIDRRSAARNGSGAAADNRAAAPPIAEPVPVTEPAPLPATPAGDGAASQSGIAAGATGVAAQAATGIGVLLVNLGTPDAATPAAVRRYLKEFLSDRRVIEKNSLLWKLAAQRRHPADPLAAQSARLPEDLEPRQERIAVQDHHALASRKTRRHSRTARQARHRRLGDALCVAVDRVAARKC